MSTLRFSPSNAIAYNDEGDFSSGAGSAVACSADEAVIVDSCVITWNFGGFLNVVPSAPGESYTIYNGSAPPSSYNRQSSSSSGYCAKQVLLDRIIFTCN
jgi:hypothetical protein